MIASVLPQDIWSERRQWYPQLPGAGCLHHRDRQAGGRTSLPSPACRVLPYMLRSSAGRERRAQLRFRITPPLPGTVQG